MPITLNDLKKAFTDNLKNIIDENVLSKIEVKEGEEVVNKNLKTVLDFILKDLVKVNKKIFNNESMIYKAQLFVDFINKIEESNLSINQMGLTSIVEKISDARSASKNKKENNIDDNFIGYSIVLINMKSSAQEILNTFVCNQIVFNKLAINLSLLKNNDFNDFVEKLKDYEDKNNQNGVNDCFIKTNIVNKIYKLKNEINESKYEFIEFVQYINEYLQRGDYEEIDLDKSVLMNEVRNNLEKRLDVIDSDMWGMEDVEKFYELSSYNVDRSIWGRVFFKEIAKQLIEKEGFYKYCLAFNHSVNNPCNDDTYLRQFAYKKSEKNGDEFRTKVEMLESNSDYQIVLENNVFYYLGSKYFEENDRLMDYLNEKILLTGLDSEMSFNITNEYGFFTLKKPFFNNLSSEKIENLLKESFKNAMSSNNVLLKSVSEPDMYIEDMIRKNYRKFYLIENLSENNQKREQKRKI